APCAPPPGPGGASCASVGGGRSGGLPRSVVWPALPVVCLSAPVVHVGALPDSWARLLSRFSSVPLELCVLGVFPSGACCPASWLLSGLERSPCFGKVLCLGPGPTHQLLLQSDLKQWSGSLRLLDQCLRPSPPLSTGCSQGDQDFLDLDWVHRISQSKYVGCLLWSLLVYVLLFVLVFSPP
ncbi:hypothetical protein LDENG_00131620, partial [Lucifuga dentata]